jgi:hypothetical protein
MCSFKLMVLHNLPFLTFFCILNPTLKKRCPTTRWVKWGGQLKKVLTVRANDSTADLRVKPEAEGQRELRSDGSSQMTFRSSSASRQVL